MTQNYKNNVFLEMKVLLEMPKLTLWGWHMWKVLFEGHCWGWQKVEFIPVSNKLNNLCHMQKMNNSKWWDLCLFRFLLFFHTPHFDLLRLTRVERALEGHRWGWQTLKFLSLITKWPLLHLAAKNVCHNWISTHMRFHITLWG